MISSRKQLTYFDFKIRRIGKVGILLKILFRCPWIQLVWNQYFEKYTMNEFSQIESMCWKQWGLSKIISMNFIQIIFREFFFAQIPFVRPVFINKRKSIVRLVGFNLSGFDSMSTLYWLLYQSFRHYCSLIQNPFFE